MTRKQRRLVLIGSGLIVLAVAAVLVLTALRDSIVFFNSPTDVVEKKVTAGSRIRLGGLVKPGSVHKDNAMVLRFTVTDGAWDVPVVYDQTQHGLVPDLFAEGQGAVAEGRLGGDGTFVATRVLAKHDEKYMPPEVTDALKRSGEWQRGEGGKP